MKYLKLSDAVAENFVRVARKSKTVPELGLAVLNGRLDLSKAKVIASVVTTENSAVWIDKAASLSKAKLEREVVAANPKMSKPEKCQPVNATHVRVECEITHHENDRFRRAQEVLNSFSVAETFVQAIDCLLKYKDPLQKAERSRERSRGRSDTSVWNLVNLRDRCECQEPMPDGTKCGSKRYLHIHHIVEKENGGRDTLENLVTLCSVHHRERHPVWARQ